MIFLAKLIALFVIILGILFLINPKYIKSYIAYWEKRIYALGAIRLLLGIILIAAAPQCRWSGMVLFLGILIFVGGILIFTLGKDKMQAWINWWNEKPPHVMRLLFMTTIGFGLLLLYSI